MLGQALRMTHQREIILEELKRVKTHPTADELYASIKERLPHISLATVYRNLETLSAIGLVRKLEITGRQKRFDGNPEPHDHISCTECHRVDDILPGNTGARSCPIPENLRDYQLHGWSIEYYGLCPECQQKRGQGGETG